MTVLNKVPNSYTIFASSFIDDCRKLGAEVEWAKLDMRGCMTFNTLSNPNQVDIDKLLNDKWKKEFPIDA